jgi:quercetin dioxygenase-like cupin family protein
MNYTYIGKTSVDNILMNLKSDLVDWDKDSTRQKVYKVHSKTKTLPIKWSFDSLVDDSTPPKHPIYYSLFDAYTFTESIRPMVEEVYGKGEFYRICLVKLAANSKVNPHKDSGDNLIKDKRIHIPIVTHPDIIFSVGGEIKNMEEGEMWTIDNSVIHSVDNPTEIDRVHLIIDYKLTGNKTLF